MDRLHSALSTSAQTRADKTAMLPQLDLLVDAGDKISPLTPAEKETTLFI
jgi:hypothetical protein